MISVARTSHTPGALARPQPTLLAKSSPTTRSFSNARHSSSIRHRRPCSSRLSQRRAAPTAETEVEASSPPREVDINEIMEILPHRYPFLLVDRVVDFIPGESAVGIKNVTINDQFFIGHFPGRPIMPGVLIIEALAQVGGVIMLEQEKEAKGTFFFGGVDKCRFRKPVVPGDQIQLKVSLISLRKRFGVAKMRGEAYVDGTLVCEADMTMVLG